MKKLLLAGLLLTSMMRNNAAADNHLEFLQNLTPDESEETCSGPAVTFADESDRQKLADYVQWLSNFNKYELEVPAEYLDLHERMVQQHPTVTFRNEKARATYLHSLGFLTESHTQARTAYEQKQQEKENKRFQKRATHVAEQLEKEYQAKAAEELKQQQHEARQKRAQERSARSLKQLEELAKKEEAEKQKRAAAIEAAELKRQQEKIKNKQLAAFEKKLADKIQEREELEKTYQQYRAEIGEKHENQQIGAAVQPAKLAAAPAKPVEPAEELTQQEWQQKNVIIPALKKVHGDAFIITPEILANTEEQYAQELIRKCPTQYNWRYIVPFVATPGAPWNSPEKCHEAALAAAHKALQKPTTQGSAASIYASMDSNQRKAPVAQPKPAAVEPDEAYDDEDGYDDEEEELAVDEKSTSVRVARYAMIGVNTALVTALVMCLGEISYQTMHNNNTVSFALKKIADMCNAHTARGLGVTGLCGVTSVALKDAVCALYAWYRSEGENFEDYMPADEDLCTKIRSYATTAAITATVAACVVIVTETIYAYNHYVYKVGSWGPQLPQNIPAAFLKAIQQHAYNLITDKYFLRVMAAIGFSAGAGEVLYDAVKDTVSAATQTVTQEAQKWGSALGTVTYRMLRLDSCYEWGKWLTSSPRERYLMSKK